MFYAELLKLKHSRMFWLVLVGALPANLITLFVMMPKVSMDGARVGVDMMYVFYRQGMMLVMMGPSMFTIMAAYIFAREYQERTINQLFSYPISRIRILAAKLSVVFALIAVTAALSSILALGVGVVQLIKQNAEWNTIWLGIRMNLMVIVLSFGTVPVAAAFGMAGKSVIPAAVVGSFATIVTVIGEIGHGRQSILFPWLTSYGPVRRMAQEIAQAGSNPYEPTAALILTVVFLVSLTYCLFHYVRTDVHSGS
ncbi:ABC transporter permease [Cohnella zeiphila]|uniref:ABC transporter permease n=1 Tax=Cohnella zeiphila TaxID=2761120 RepID=UPI0030801766